MYEAAENEKTVVGRSERRCELIVVRCSRDDKADPSLVLGSASARLGMTILEGGSGEEERRAGMTILMEMWKRRTQRQNDNL